MTFLKICLMLILFIAVTDGVRWLGNKFLKAVWPKRWPITDYQTAYETALVLLWGAVALGAWTIVCNAFPW